MKKSLIAAAALILLSACGKMGKLEYPPGAFYPRQYPAPHFPKSPVAETERPDADSARKSSEKKVTVSEKTAPETKEDKK